MEHWSPIYRHGTVHVDVNEDERTNLQLVIRGHHLLSALYHAGFIPLNYEQHEFALRGGHAELRQRTPTYTSPESLGGVFYPWDFRKLFMQDWVGTAYEAEPASDGLIFRRLYFVGGHGPKWYSVPGQDHRTYYTTHERTI